ncbi:hypothetical protein ACFSC3_08330 [Sphingomonas floccifaciens]|uniref:Uncharacterized protein n=1 Tax=Sphingomonas floccifaciens TaxID=1844115 RepID=A0ABW4NBT0_9SPHN
MLKLQTKRRLLNAGRDRDRLAAIEASVAALTDDDLLDLADIFARGGPTPLRDIAGAEMQRRNITL